MSGRRALQSVRFGAWTQVTPTTWVARGDEVWELHAELRAGQIAWRIISPTGEHDLHGSTATLEAAKAEAQAHLGAALKAR